MASGHRTLFPRATGFLASSIALLLLVGAAWSAPEKVAGGIRFTYRDPNAGTVAWAGAFNNWSATANLMTKDGSGAWSAVIALPAGEQQYKFVVDGQWFADPENPVTAGEFGNSVVKIGADGGLVAQAATSNTAYNPKITMSGRTHALFEEIFSTPRSRFELTRPWYDVDLGFQVRMSDLVNAHLLMNINPQKEDVQDYRSRLNWKRGSLDFHQPDLQILAFASDTVPTWDDPAHLVGNIGVFGHPFGHQQAGFLATTPKYGFDTKVLYSDNNTPGGTTYPSYLGTADFLSTDPVSLLQVTPGPAGGYTLIPGEVVMMSATDVGDGGVGYGFGDGATNVFAASVRRQLGSKLRLGLMGRSDRGFHLGSLVKITALGDSTFSSISGNTAQQWFAGGGDVRLDLRPGLAVYGEYLQGARRLDLKNSASQIRGRALAMNNASVSYLLEPPSTFPNGVHFNTDESARLIAGGDWTMAQGDITLRVEYERQTHRYPSWYFPPLSSPDPAHPDVVRAFGVEYQRQSTAHPASIDNQMDELRLRWDRNWRYYLGREVKTSLGAEFTKFHYDPVMRSRGWQYQMWFPAGNLWLQQDGQVVSMDRLTSLGVASVYRLRPSLDIPIRRARNIDFHWRGTFAGTPPSLEHFKLKEPRYAESIFQLGCDLNSRVRLTNDTRWVKYDTPALALTRGYVSQFSELTYRFSGAIHVGVGFGVDPVVLDPVTNEFAYVGRETYLAQQNANGFIAETNWLSLAPQIAAAERNLQGVHRFQFEAVVRF